MKQTAVEWFATQVLRSRQLGFISNKKFNELLEEAKEMQNKQMCSFAEFVATYPDKNININGEMLHAKSKYDGAERTIDLFEQYYNENNKSE